jgi:hypothetical protein
MPHPHGGFNQAAQAAFFIGVNMKNTKKNARPRGAKKALQPISTPLPVPRPTLANRPRLSTATPIFVQA